MSILDANREAQRRWGQFGYVRRRPDGMCYVGTIGGDAQPNGTFPYGVGWSWEEAFADSELRAAS